MQAGVRALLIKAAVASCFVNILILAGPLYMLQIYDRVLSSRSTETLLVITILTFGLFAAMAGFDFARGALLARAGTDFDAQLQKLCFYFSMDTARRSLVHADQPLKDLQQVRQFLASPALTAFFDAPWTPIFLALIFLMHWLLGVVTVVGVILLLALAFVNERVSRHKTLHAHKEMREADTLATAALRNVAAAKAMGMRDVLTDRWQHLASGAATLSLLASDSTGGLTALSKALRMFLQSAILGTGAWLAIQGEVSPGVMIAASIIAGRALAPIELATGQWNHFTLAQAAYARLREIFAELPPEIERTPLPKLGGLLELDRVFCQPGMAEQPVVKGMSFALRPGEALGVIGPSASGKSTLGRAIVGVENIVAGDVRLDGASLSQWEQHSLGRQVGYLPQDIELFAGTAAENICRFDESASADDIIAAARMAGAHDMILSLADGYDTAIGEGGQFLSNGQRQRLALARALFGDPALIVLDEPNSNLDSEGEAALSQAILRQKERGATMVVIAHRAGALAAVDKLMVLVDGELRDFGSRDEVLKKLVPVQVTPLRPAPNDLVSA